jgi:type IV pilus assembly protein PilB
MKEGMITLRQDGWLRVVEGRTSVEEVLRVAGRMEE